MRLPKVSSIRGAIVGTEAAIIMVFDSILGQMKRSAVASGSLSFSLSLSESEGEK